MVISEMRGAALPAKPHYGPIRISPGEALPCKARPNLPSKIAVVAGICGLKRHDVQTCMGGGANKSTTMPSTTMFSKLARRVAPALTLPAAHACTTVATRWNHNTSYNGGIFSGPCVCHLVTSFQAPKQSQLLGIRHQGRVRASV